ncbi:hypothetical protein [Mucilaginibacter sp.]|uniref:hypothetical protein n=1 Tax=Mucilaginibacter sp. TaxID=1882438 RepID=UPI0035BBAF01
MQAHAQKAYDIIFYRANIYGDRTKLELADGYLIASKVTIHSQYGDQVFAANANEPNDKGDLKFDPEKGTGRYKDMTGSWIILNRSPSTNHPNKINAIYWDGKMQRKIVFKR